MPVYITSPIYYVNDVPHIGHAYTNLACDVLARYHRLRGDAVYLLTGTDEHGQKIAKAAEAKGVTPQAFTDEYSAPFRALAARMQITHDDFIRTTEPRHIRGAQGLWQRLQDAGQIYLGGYAGWYAVRDEAFYQEAELVDGKAPTGAPVEWVEEPSYFFALSKWQEPLLNWYRDNPDVIWPESRRNEVMRFVEGGLKDLSISRTSFDWGIPIPGAPEHVMYVWLDALTNYISALGFPDTEAPLYQEFWSHAIHIVGKDIVRFHAVYWPAFLMAAGLPLPKRIIAHGWWTNDGQKISKSLGNVIDPNALIDHYGLEAVRYFLMREVPFGQDGNFTHQGLIQRMNSELANTLGNLAQRTLKMVQDACGGCIPTPAANLEAEPLLKAVNASVMAYEKAMAEPNFSVALEAIVHLGIQANAYIDEKAPWQLKKVDPQAMQHVLYVLLEAIRAIGVMLVPFIPDSASKLLSQLAVDPAEHVLTSLHQPLQPGTLLPAPQVVFPRYV
jgi:methionyl-tRNA synthetase